MNKQTETGKPATKRAPYEAPRLTIVELRPEERLLAGAKAGECAMFPSGS